MMRFKHWLCETICWVIAISIVIMMLSAVCLMSFGIATVISDLSKLWM